MTIGRPGAGFCVSTALFVCAVLGFPSAPAQRPPTSGLLTLSTTTATAAHSPADVAPGGTFTVYGTGYASDAAVNVSIYSSPVDLADVVADANGNVVASVTIPASLTGPHTLSAIGNAPDGSARSLQASVNIVSPAPGSIGALPRTGIRVTALVTGGLGMILAGLVLVRTAAFRRRLLPL